MFTSITKTVAVALILASASLAVIGSATAAPQQTRIDQEKLWMDHASQNVDGGNGN